MAAGVWGEEDRDHIRVLGFFFYTCCCSFETGNNNSILFLQWQLPLLLTMKWNICYPGFMIRSEVACEEPGMAASRAYFRWRVRMLTLFFFFLSYGVVRNASNKYWWHFSFARIKIYEPQEIDLEAATNQCDSERVVWGSLEMNTPFQSTYLIYGPLQDFKDVQ